MRSGPTAGEGRALRLATLAAVLGPGLLAGLSDDDPAGVTTYSVLGADYGYRLLWVLLLSTLARMLFHDLGARMGVVTGQGLVGLVRHRYGVRVATATLVALVVANVGTAAAEFAGIAAGAELLGVSRSFAVPVAAVAVTTVAASLVLLPKVPLVPLLLSTQTLNAVLLVPLLVVLQLLSRDRETMGDLVVTRRVAAAQGWSWCSSAAASS